MTKYYIELFTQCLFVLNVQIQVHFFFQIICPEFKEIKMLEHHTICKVLSLFALELK